MKLIHVSIQFVFVLILTVSCSHYRGSMISWRVTNATSSPLVVEIFQRHAWSYAYQNCTSAQVAAGNRLIGSGNIICSSTCPPNISTIGSVTVPCTGFNQIENYVNGEGRFTFRVPVNSRFRAAFTGSAWFSLVTGGGNWSVATEINTFMRPNGRYNQAPIVTMLPIIRLRRFLTYNIKINVADNDFDRYTCTWSNITQECSGICRSSLALPATTYLNETSCVLRFRPVTIGYYAIALTIFDFENDSSTTPLSRVPIQFIFNVWDSNATCSSSPIYIGDVAADQCIFLEPGQTITMILRIQVRCPNATLANIIGVYPAGFTQSPIYTDPYDPTIYAFKVYYTGNANQIGQNLLCFAGVDSIGNQADSTCLRLTIQISSESRHTLYINNATRFPMNLVSKYQSNWTIIYPTGIAFVRPNTDAYVRFKIKSTNQDFVIYNVVKQINNILYQSDRLVIISDVVFNAGENYYIYIDPGVFLPIATCLRDSMGITDSKFWPFYTASEPNTTVTTSTTTTSTTATSVNRTVPTLRTFTTGTTHTTETKTTTTSFTTTNTLTTTKELKKTSSFPISGIVGIVIGSIILGILMINYIIRRRRSDEAIPSQNKDSSPESTTSAKKRSLPDITRQYLINTRRRSQGYHRSTSNINNPSLPINSKTLVSIEC